MAGSHHPYTRGRATTTQGRGKSRNEDRLLLLDHLSEPVRSTRRGALFAVADGVSSSRTPWAAAETTCENLATFYTAQRAANEHLLLDLIESADATVRMTAPGSACTLAALWIQGTTGRVFSLGDSTVLQCRDGWVRPLTPRFGGRGLNAYVGMGQATRLTVHTETWRVRPGDLYLVFSDGLLNTIGEAGLFHLATRSPGVDEAVERVEELLKATLPKDDATLVAVEVHAGPAPA